MYAPSSATSRVTTSSSEETECTTCLLLDRVPPEIRNSIYELMFAVGVEEDDEGEGDTDEDDEDEDDEDEDDEDDDDEDSDSNDSVTKLVKARPSQKALVMTCRQIYQESRGIYRSNYQKYWTKTVFTISHDDLNIPCGWKYIEDEWETYGRDWLSEQRWEHGSSEDQLRRSEAQLLRAVRREDLEHATKLRIFDNVEDRYDLVDKCGVWTQYGSWSATWTAGVSYGGDFIRILPYGTKAGAKAGCSEGAVVPLSMQVVAIMTT